MIFRTDKNAPGVDLTTGLYEFDDDEMYDLVEELIEESTWNNTQQLKAHYNKHVLKSGESFDSIDPKFSSNMSLEEYKKCAEKLTREPAGLHDDKNSEVIGFRVAPVSYDDSMSPRYIKIRKFVTNKYFPKEARRDGHRYREAVLYVDTPKDDNIISYMILKPSRFYKYVTKLFGEELPENQEIANTEEE